jgi:hypothetical protein
MGRSATARAAPGALGAYDGRGGILVDVSDDSAATDWEDWTPAVRMDRGYGVTVTVTSCFLVIALSVALATSV